MLLAKRKYRAYCEEIKGSRKIKALRYVRMLAHAEATEGGIALSTIHLFVDTNFFIQCRKYDKIDWEIDELENVTEVVVLISRPVVSEIDRQKHDGNSRRARRARAANSLFGQVLDEKELVRQVGDMGIRIKFAPSYKLQDLKREVPELDVERNDDELVATAWLYQQESQDIDVRVLTHDIGMAISATRCGLAYIMIPDAWILLPEKDDKDRKIARLEDELRAFSQQFPMIEISEFSVSGQGPISLSELTEDMIDQLEEYVKQIHPLEVAFPNAKFMKTAFSSPLFRVIPPTAQEISDYEERYAQWLLSFREWVHQAFSALRDRKILSPIEFMLTNAGWAPVDHLVIEITTHGNVEMAPPSYSENENGFELPEIPHPPSAPKGRVVSHLDSNLFGMNPAATCPPYSYSSLDPVFARLGRDSAKDRNAFYWKEEKPDQFCQRWVLECEEFRHKLGGESFEILVRGDSSTMIQGAISIVVSGTNLREPYRFTRAIKQPVVRQEPYSVMRDLVRECF